MYEYFFTIKSLLINILIFKKIFYRAQWFVNVKLLQTTYIYVTDVNNVQHPDYPVDNIYSIFFPNLTNYANDVAAAAGGVPIGGMYVSAGIMHIRVS